MTSLEEIASLKPFRASKGEKSFAGEFSFTTCDFGLLENISETHKGRAAASLPIDFKPFNTVALLERENGTVQENSAEHPHWVQVSGDVTADKAVLTATSDKIMTFFASASPAIRVNADFSGSKVEFKIQETRNADVTPGWRTIRVLRAEDFPFDGVLYLNSESRFIKLTAPTLSGSVTVSEFRVADANGQGLGEGYDLFVDGIRSEGKGQALRTEFFTLSGEKVSKPGKGFYVVRNTDAQGNQTTQKVCF